VTHAVWRWEKKEKGCLSLVEFGSEGEQQVGRRKVGNPVEGPHDLLESLREALEEDE
jgi:hypothetical protein